MITIALTEQIHLYSVGTDDFYYKSEDNIHKRLMRGYGLKSRLRKRRNAIHKLHKEYDLKPNIYDGDKQYIDGLYTRTNRLLARLKEGLYSEFEENKGGVRSLKAEGLNDRKVVSVFSSALTRTIGCEINELTDDMVIVQAFFFQILEDIILNGFNWNNEKYIVFTASAGQIRTKKTVFIKESTFKKYENTITCGMTKELINERGLININKYLAYLALQNSATEEWLDFDIQKTIVVKDFETEVEALVDFIDDKTYKIERKLMKVPIPHTDGAGIMLPSFCNKNRMIRMPWVKGLLIPFDFQEFIYRHSKKDRINYAIVKDIYGKEYDIIKDDIQVIMTESQFKLHKLYESWDEYKAFYNKFNSQTGYCNEEQEYIKDARINYQMLQSLSDMKTSEIEKISAHSNHLIKTISSEKETMMKLMNVTKENRYKDYYQQGIQYYPQLLNDAYSRDTLRQIKRSTVKRAKEAKLFIDGKYTFICPDMYAFCENLFLGLENPKGLLEDGEVSCNLYNNGDDLDCLRSPHLFLEHAVRNNVVDERHSKWFITKGLYTSSHDVISKLLQFDCDGDASLVCRDKTLVEVAKRNIEKFDVVPLYYDMKQSSTVSINNQVIYEGLTTAYRGGNIGIISNDISKVWNNGKVDAEAIEVIKLLCMENNFSIDFAKTLYKPERPAWAKEKILRYTRDKLPHFFKYAKDKRSNAIEDLNESTVNKLDTIIKNPNLNFVAACGRFYYKKLMNNPKFVSKESDSKIIGIYEELDHKEKFMIRRSPDYSTVENGAYVYGKIRDEILDVYNDPIYVTDVLVDYLYNNKKDNRKLTLWECFGDTIVDNIKRNVTSEFRFEAIECRECGILIERVNSNSRYCGECLPNVELVKNRVYAKNSMRKKRLKNEC